MREMLPDMYMSFIVSLDFHNHPIAYCSNSATTTMSTVRISLGVCQGSSMLNVNMLYFCSLDFEWCAKKKLKTFGCKMQNPEESAL